MINDLNFLNRGQPWPPSDPDTTNRIKSYVEHAKLFEGRHGELPDYEDSFRRIERVIGNFEDYISYANVINYHKLLSLKITDLLLSEEPDIKSADQDTIDTIIDNTDMFSKLYQAYIDVSRYGDSVLYVENDEDTKSGNFQVIDPLSWIPIMELRNIKKVKQHVITWQVKADDGTSSLLVQIHNKGYFEERLYRLESNSFGTILIGDLAMEPIIVKTGLKGFAIINLHNLVTSDRVTGISDYTSVNDLIKEIMIRTCQIDRILDIHANPGLAVPGSALTRDPVTDELVMKAGNTYIRDSANDPMPEYITWNGELEAAFRQLEFLVNQLAVISEMGSLIKMDDENQSGLSGRALKYKLLSPLTKAKRLTLFTNKAIKQLFKSISELGGPDIKNLTNESISINWRDGIPDDSVENAQVIKSRRDSGTLSVKRALIKYDDMTSEDADIEIALIEGDSEPEPDTSGDDVNLIDSNLTEDDVNNM